MGSYGLVTLSRQDTLFGGLRLAGRILWRQTWHRRDATLSSPQNDKDMADGRGSQVHRSAAARHANSGCALVGREAARAVTSARVAAKFLGDKA